jgi:hypothetical protein
MKRFLEHYMLSGIPRDAASDAAAAAAAAAANKPWYEGKLDQEMVGRMQNRGWHDKPADVVAVEALKAHHEAEKMLGIPKDQLVRKPNPADEASTKAFWQQFGVPAKAEDYKITALQDKDGKVTNEALDKAIRTAAFTANVPMEAANQIAGEIAKSLAATDTEKAAAAQTKLDAERGDLKKNWGDNFERNKLVAQDGAKKLGLDPEVVAALENVAGYAKTMEALRVVGAMGGESDYKGGDGKNGGELLTVQQATARLEELKLDKEWMTRYFNGGAVEKRLFEQLTTIIAGGDDTEASVRMSSRPR